EHVQSPFVAVQEAGRVLKPGGVALLASVMNFPIHSFPSDYWRFTHEGVRKLFPELDFPSHLSNAMTSQPGECLSLNASTGLIYLSGGHQRRAGRYLRGLAGLAS
ncbi:MAG: hypothetical protein ACE5LB_15100, partial [Acidiferrobacterales bacterium]